MKELAGVSAYGLRVMFLYGQNVIDQALSPSYQIFSFSLLGLYEGCVGLLVCAGGISFPESDLCKE